MGCDHYVIGSGEDSPVVGFSEADDTTACLCCFPWGRETLDPDEVRSLALLGAAVVQAYQTGSAVFIPQMLPTWVVREVDRILGTKPHDCAEAGCDT
jgi:hypothetical protein